jgi:hypothetical protein
MALEEEELAGFEAWEPNFYGEVCGEGAEIATAVAALGAGEGDVGMVETVFELKAAGGGGSRDALLEREEGRRGLDAQVEDASAEEDAGRGRLDGNRWAVECGEMGDEAGVLVGGGGTEELEGDVPGVGRGPAEIGRISSQTCSETGEPGEEGFVERESEKETHGGSVSRTASQRVRELAS